MLVLPAPLLPFSNIYKILHHRLSFEIFKVISFSNESIQYCLQGWEGRTPPAILSRRKIVKAIIKGKKLLNF